MGLLAHAAGDGRIGINEHVLLVSMPFGALERPALSLGLLKAHCARLGVPCDTRYLNLDFVDDVGLGDYQWLCSDSVPYTAFAGEWLFTAALYGARPYADAAYIDEVLTRTWKLNDADLARLRRMRAKVEPFLERCMRAVPWPDYTLVGFTSVFQQNIASLALAARIRRHYPEVTIAFGGANWEEVMGIALLEQFPFVDLAFSGEADESFPAVLAARRDGQAVHGIRGVTANQNRGVAAAAAAERVQDMDNVPLPDFDAFFQQLRASAAAGAISPILLVETARGCWWGERAHCTFCGLNGATMAFRSKTPGRVIEEIATLRERYDVRTFSVVDDILDMGYFRSVLPRLAEARSGIDFFWEIKANLNHDQVRLLRDAGVLSVQPGIESLSDNVLRLMRKGTTAFRNIELLKWCKEYGVKPYWNLLYGFPGETTADYERTADLIRAIWHLDPPTGYGPIRVDRFSPYHADPSGFGLTNLRPMAPFTFLYPFDPSTLMNIAYYFDFDYADDRLDDSHAQTAIDMVRIWMADRERGMLRMEMDGAGDLALLDTRGERANAPRRAVLRGWKAAVFSACDRTQPFAALVALPTIRNESVATQDLHAFLDRCVDNDLMVTSNHSWLNVAIYHPARDAIHEAERFSRISEKAAG